MNAQEGNVSELLASAETAVNTVESYIKRNRWDIQRGTRNLAEQAAHNLQEAKSVRNIEEQKRLAEQAIDQASEASKLAHRDVHWHPSGWYDLQEVRAGNMQGVKVTAIAALVLLAAAATLWFTVGWEAAIIIGGVGIFLLLTAGVLWLGRDQLGPFA